ncbi:hypothetical protein RUM44_011870 [Polyplax serrata]|uniref:Uncharacterized protein n=1 Tax=Polyplax serrata TaxID=468196 RepID=A0ABR1BDM6_POLSC
MDPNLKGMKGCIYKNGVERQSSQGAFNKEICYIMQDDQLHPIFTVMETMTMAADLKLGRNVSDKVKLILIDDILQTLGLSSTKQTKCERLSGGQRKRLSIALELIDNPPVMFLDEPTTGLDSSSSLQCIKALKALAKGGRTIVCTIHQPSASIYEMFDHVYFLAEGYCMYQGSSLNTVPYLLSVGLSCPQYHNPADFISEVISCEYGNFTQQLAITAQDTRWRSITTKTDETANERLNDEKTQFLIRPPSEMSRLYILLYRNIIKLHRDWTVIHLKVILHFLVGILLGLNYQGCGNDGSKSFENLTFLFCTITYISFTSMMPAILTFPSELSVLKKENFNNWYTLKTYYSAFIVTSTPVQFLLCMAYAFPSYYLSNQPLDITRFSMFLGICLLVGLTAEGLGLYLGTLDNTVNALFFGSVFTAYLLLYSGCLCLFPQMPKYLYIFSYLSYNRYAYEGLILSVYGYGRQALPCPDDVMYCHLRFPDKIIDEMGVADGWFWFDFLALLGILFFFRTASFIALRQKVACGKI